MQLKKRSEEAEAAIQVAREYICKEEQLSPVDLHQKKEESSPWFPVVNIPSPKEEEQEAKPKQRESMSMAVGAALAAQALAWTLFCRMPF